MSSPAHIVYTASVATGTPPNEETAQYDSLAALRAYPELFAIAKCESGLRQKDPAGRVLQGVAVSQDRGILQINEHYHKEEAMSAGYDIETIEGNIGYGIALYKAQGTRPWNASKACWSKLLGSS